MKIGVHRSVGALGTAAELRARLAWKSAPEGGLLGLIKISSSGATALRLGIRVKSVPAAAEFRFFDEALHEIQLATGSEIAKLVESNLQAGDPEVIARTYWSPVIEGGSGGLEVYLPPGISPDALDISVPDISHLFVSPRTGPVAADFLKIGEAASCHNDITCPAHAAWSTIAKAVARMVFSDTFGSYLCTGTLLNDLPGSGSPWFLTANHCISTQSVASTLVTYWFYRSSSCNVLALNPASTTLSGGASLLYHSANTDTSFMRLNGDPPAGASYAGWTTAVPSIGSTNTGIHHPRGDLQKISYGSVTAFYSCSDSGGGGFSCTSATSATGGFIDILFNSGTAEGGSSGSGIFLDGGQQLIGQLYGGNSSCTNPGGSNVYGRFDFAYQQGGLGAWLNPAASATALSSGFALGNLAGATASATYFYIDVPSGATSLTVQTSGGSGDVDLYVRFGSAPTTSAYDCRPYLPGNDESCTQSSPPAGRYHVLVHGFTAYSGVSVLASYAIASQPTVGTSAATTVTSGGAVLNGSANPGGSDTTAWFRYATSSPGLCNDSFGTRAPSTGGAALGSGNSTLAFSQGITGLAQGTTYYYCAIAQNSIGTAFGAVVSFTTPLLPTATTSAATAINGSGATLNGSGNPNGANSTGWFRFGVTNPGTCNDSFGTRAPSSGGSPLGAGTSSVAFSQAVTGLAPGTTYYYCAVVQSAQGIAFGAVLSLATASSPTASTSPATSVASGSATLNGSSNPNGSDTTAWFRYATVSPGTCNDTFGTRAPSSGGSVLGAGTSSVAFSLAVTGLTPGTTYYYCALAQNSTGTAFGALQSFATTSGAPSQYDFNADGKPDLIWSNTVSGATYLWRMNGPTLISDSFYATIDPSWKIQGVADFNGDGHPDIVWRNTANGSCYVWYTVNGVFTGTDAFLFSLPPEWVIQGVADFNGDGKPDFLMRNSTTGNAFVWFFNNNVPIGDQFLFNVDPSWKVEAVGDVNLDGQPDLLFRSMTSGLSFAWNTNYTGGVLSLGTSSPMIYSIDPVWEVVQLADWNGDGKPDLLFRNASTGLVFVWYLDGVTLGASDFVFQIDPSWEIVPRR